MKPCNTLIYITKVSEEVAASKLRTEKWNPDIV
jgi:hypothetical protein